MYSFKCDYSEGCHPRILKALEKFNIIQEKGYGKDRHTKNAISIIKKILQNDNVDIHLICGGTQTNLISISSFLKPHEACICVHSGHIAGPETGSIEYTGHKVITVDSTNGKITTDKIEQVLSYHRNEHFVKPKLVYISNSTEVGTVYTKEEMKILSEFCKDKNLILYVDGARLGSALCVKEANLTLKDMGDFSDTFCIGGTKNGALIGEALVIKNEKLKEDFRYHIKQRGGLLAKGRVLGIQFEELFKDNLYFDLANHANEMASILTKGLKEANCKFLVESKSNQVFPILSNEKIKILQEKFSFNIWNKVDNENCTIRLVTSWATKKEAAFEFIQELKNLEE